MMDLPEKAGEQSQNNAVPQKSSPESLTLPGIIRKVKNAGVARPAILSHLAHVKKFSQITNMKRTPPVLQTRKRVEDFVAKVQKRQPGNQPFNHKKQNKQKSPNWQKMEMTLPNGSAINEEQQISSVVNPFAIQPGVPVGQVIPPFNPQPTGESEFSKRMKNAAESHKVEPLQQTKKRIVPPQCRLFSKVVEVNPRKTEQTSESTSNNDAVFPEAKMVPASQISKVEPNHIQPIPESKSKPVERELNPKEIKKSQPEEKPESNPVTRTTSNIIQRQSEPVKHETRERIDETPPRIEPDLSTEYSKPEKSFSDTKPGLPLQIKRSRIVPYKLSPVKVPAKPVQSIEKTEKQNLKKPVELESKPETKQSKTADESQPVTNDKPEKKEPFLPVEEKINQQSKPVTASMPKIPLTLKPTIKPMKRVTSPSILPRIKMPLNIVQNIVQNIAQNIVQRSPQKPQKKASKPLELGFLTTRVRNIQQATSGKIPPQVDIQQSISPDQTRRTPETAKTASPLRTLASKSQNRAQSIPVVSEPARTQPTSKIIRYTPSTVIQRQVSKPVIHLGTPLQLSIHKKTSQPVSLLTTNRIQTSSSVKSVAHNKLIPPVSMNPRQEIKESLVSLGIPSQTNPAEQKPIRKRELINPPKVAKQARTFGQSIQRKAESRSGMQSQHPAKSKNTSQAISTTALLSAMQNQTNPTSIPAGISDSALKQLLGLSNSRNKPKGNTNPSPVVGKSMHSAPGNIIQRSPADQSPNYITDPDKEPEEVGGNNHSSEEHGNAPDQGPDRNPPAGNYYRSSAPDPQQDQENQQPPAGGMVFLTQPQGHNPNQAQQNQAGGGYYTSQRQEPGQSQQQRPEAVHPASPSLPPYELRMPEPEYAAAAQDTEPVVYETPQRAESVRPQNAELKSSQPNLQQLAKDVLPIIKKMMALERERAARR